MDFSKMNEAVEEGKYRIEIDPGIVYSSRSGKNFIEGEYFCKAEKDTDELDKFELYPGYRVSIYDQESSIKAPKFTGYTRTNNLEYFLRPLSYLDIDQILDESKENNLKRLEFENSEDGNQVSLHDPDTGAYIHMT